MKKNLVEDLCCWSVSARSGHPAELREKLSFLNPYEQSILKKWKEKCSLEFPHASFVYLKTCHRVELYGHGVAPGYLLKSWEELSGDSVYKLELYKGKAAQEHMIRVCSSLESEVLGETQITGQVKQSLIEAKTHHLLSPELDRCFQHALSTTKKIRSLTSISQGTISVAHVSIEGLKDFFESYKDKKALVIGSGSMAKISIKKLLNLGLKQITWINRTRSKIEKDPLAAKCTIDSYEKRHELMWKHSVTVSAVQSPQPILNFDKAKALEKTVHKESHAEAPRVLLDLGLPRNIEGQLHAYRGFFLRNVDEFKNRSEKQEALRKQSVKQAESILKEELEKFLQNSATWARGPLITQLIQELGNFKQEVLEENTLENDPKMRYIVSAIFNKLTHRVLAEMNGLDDEVTSSLVLESLVRALKGSQQENRVPKKLESSFVTKTVKFSSQHASGSSFSKEELN